MAHAFHQLTRVGARLFGLDRYLDLDVGAYGTDHDDRSHLVKVARQRAEAAHCGRYEAESTMLIGDTANDVGAAHDGGERIIAVATGSDSTEDLANAGAETVLKDVTRTDDLLAAIYQEQREE